MSTAAEIQSLAETINMTSQRIMRLAGDLLNANPVTRQEFTALEGRVARLEAQADPEPTPVPGPGRPVPLDLTTLTVRDGEVIMLERGKVYQGPLTLRGVADVLLQATGEGANPLIDLRGNQADTAILLTNCQRVVIDGIDTAGGRYGRIVENSWACEMRNFDQRDAMLHAIWLRGSETTGCTIEDFESHDNGTINFLTSSGELTNVGHGVVTSRGANGNLVRRFKSYRNAEDGVQQGPDDGNGNVFSEFELFANEEDGVDVKGGDARYEKGLIHGNKRNAVNLHPDRPATSTFKEVDMRDGGISALEVKKRARFVSEGGNIITGKPEGAPAVKIMDGLPQALFRDDQIVDGGHPSSRDCSIYIAAGTGHRFENVTAVRERPIKVWVTGTADDIEFTGGNIALAGIKVDGVRQVRVTPELSAEEADV